MVNLDNLSSGLKVLISYGIFDFLLMSFIPSKIMLEYLEIARFVVGIVGLIITILIFIQTKKYLKERRKTNKLLEDSKKESEERDKKFQDIYKRIHNG
jgi:Na+/H+-translocating membrane pyrophosphatase